MPASVIPPTPGSTTTAPSNDQTRKAHSLPSPTTPHCAPSPAPAPTAPVTPTSPTTSVISSPKRARPQEQEQTQQEQQQPDSPLLVEAAKRMRDTLDAISPDRDEDTNPRPQAQAQSQEEGDSKFAQRAPALLRHPAPEPQDELARIWWREYQARAYVDSEDEEDVDKAKLITPPVPPPPFQPYAVSPVVVDALMHDAASRLQPGYACVVARRARSIGTKRSLSLLREDRAKLPAFCAAAVEEALSNHNHHHLAHLGLASAQNTPFRSCPACSRAVQAIFADPEQEPDLAERCTCAHLSVVTPSTSCNPKKSPRERIQYTDSCSCESIGDVVEELLYPALVQRMAQRHPWLARDVADAVVAELGAEVGPELVALLADPNALFERMVAVVDEGLGGLTQRARRKVLREDMRVHVQALHPEKHHKILAVIMRDKDSELMRYLHHPEQLKQRVRTADNEVATNEEKAREKRALKRQAQLEATRTSALTNPSTASQTSAAQVAAINTNRALLEAQRSRVQRTGTMHLYRTAPSKPMTKPTTTQLVNSVMKNAAATSKPNTSFVSSAVKYTPAGSKPTPPPQPQLRTIPLVNPRGLQTNTNVRKQSHIGPALPAVKRRKLDAVVNTSKLTKVQVSQPQRPAPLTVRNTNQVCVPNSAPKKTPIMTSAKASTKLPAPQVKKTNAIQRIRPPAQPAPPVPAKNQTPQLPNTKVLHANAAAAIKNHRN